MCMRLLGNQKESSDWIRTPFSLKNSHLKKVREQPIPPLGLNFQLYFPWKEYPGGHLQLCQTIEDFSGHMFIDRSATEPSMQLQTFSYEIPFIRFHQWNIISVLLYKSIYIGSIISFFNFANYCSIRTMARLVNIRTPLCP